MPLAPQASGLRQVWNPSSEWHISLITLPTIIFCLRRFEISFCKGDLAPPYPNPNPNPTQRHFFQTKLDWSLKIICRSSPAQSIDSASLWPALPASSAGLPASSDPSTPPSALSPSAAGPLGALSSGVGLGIRILPSRSAIAPGQRSEWFGMWDIYYIV